MARKGRSGVPRPLGRQRDGEIQGLQRRQTWQMRTLCSRSGMQCQGRAARRRQVHLTGCQARSRRSQKTRQSRHRGKVPQRLQRPAHRRHPHLSRPQRQSRRLERRLRSQQRQLHLRRRRHLRRQRHLRLPLRVWPPRNQQHRLAVWRRQRMAAYIAAVMPYRRCTRKLTTGKQQEICSMSYKLRHVFLVFTAYTLKI